LHSSFFFLSIRKPHNLEKTCKLQASLGKSQF
jgi:hypothetical protein